MAEYDAGGDFAPALAGNNADAQIPEINPDKPINPLGTPSNTGFDPNATPGTDGSNPPAGKSTTTNGDVDWSSLLGIYGMPADVAAKVAQIFKDNPDVSTAIQLALAFIRGTDWYKATYPGIQYGLANGLFSNEAGYRQYVNAVRQYYKQYLGRDPTGDEITQMLANGSDPSVVGKTLEGNAYADTYRNDIEYYAGAFGTGNLSKEDLQAYGQEKVGLGSSRGYQIDKMINDAIRRYQGAFGGAAATPTGITLGPVGLASTGLAGQRESLSNTPDISA